LFNEFPEAYDRPMLFQDLNNVGAKWLKYEGMFDRNKKAGKGKLYLVNGERFEGEFLDDYVNGEGVYYKKDGSYIRGLWRNNVLFHIM
jgi:hypothetical protein